jgi:predicted Na+-dependent transporter
MRSKLLRHWFLVLLAVCFCVGHQFASTIDVVSQWPYFRSGIVFAVMMSTGLSLRAGAIGRSITRPAAAIVAIGCNVLLVPLLAYPTQFFLPYETFGGCGLLLWFHAPWRLRPSGLAKPVAMIRSPF